MAGQPTAAVVRPAARAHVPDRRGAQIRGLLVPSRRARASRSKSRLKRDAVPRGPHAGRRCWRAPDRSASETRSRPRARGCPPRRARAASACRTRDRDRTRAAAHRSRRGPRAATVGARGRDRGARRPRRARAARAASPHAITRNLRRPMSWPDVVMTSTVQRPTGFGGKRRLAGPRAIPLAPPALDRVEADDVHHAPVLPPHVRDGLAQPGGRVDRRVRRRARAGGARPPGWPGPSARAIPGCRRSTGGRPARRTAARAGSRRRRPRPPARRPRPPRRSSRPRHARPCRTRGAPPASPPPPPPTRSGAARRTAGRRAAGSATLSAAKIETTKKRAPSQGRGWTIALYQGSNVARTMRPTRSATKSDVHRRERRRRVVRREHEEQEAVIERLHRVVDGGRHQARRDARACRSA